MEHRSWEEFVSWMEADAELLESKVVGDECSRVGRRVARVASPKAKQKRQPSEVYGAVVQNPNRRSFGHRMGNTHKRKRRRN